MKTVTIPVDDEILFTLKMDINNIQADFMQSLAIRYFKEKRLGLGLASRMAGMDKNDFVHLLSKHNIDIYQYTDEELQQLIPRIRRKPPQPNCLRNEICEADDHNWFEPLEDFKEYM